MDKLNRRQFIKATGIGVGAVMASKFMPSNVVAKNPLSYSESKFGLASEDLRKILAAALGGGGDFADIFMEYRIANSILMEEEIIKSSSESISVGVGLRVIKGSQTGYAYTNELGFEKIRQAAITAAAIASDGSPKVKVADMRDFKTKNSFYNIASPITNSEIPLKINLISAAYNSAKNHDSRIIKVMVTMADELQEIVIVNSEGLMAYDYRPQVRLSAVATAEHNGIKISGSANSGGRVGYDYYSGYFAPTEIGKRAAEEAIILLSAKDAPAGEQVVVLSKDQSGVMIHEAVGHPLEADANWKKSSIMWDKVGQMVANPNVTIFDDATIPGYRGSLNIDDEGTETQNVMLIEKGKLVGFMNDRLGAKMLGVEPNGHGRRESFKNMPIPRMNNTVLAGGDYPADEIIASVKNGFYAVSYQGGMVNDTGKFTFSINLGYIIENGKLTYPVKNATLIGTNIQILKEVSMIGNDMGFFLGTCGKDGQSVPVTCGTPTLKIDKMTVGGMA